MRHNSRLDPIPIILIFTKTNQVLDKRVIQAAFVHKYFDKEACAAKEATEEGTSD
jgi:hypothetical protein